MSAPAPSDMAPTTYQAPGTDATSAWLAAYALGLAYSAHPDQQRLACLLDAAQPHPGGLEAAHLRLQAPEMAGHISRQRALHLLEQAMTAHTPPVPPGGGVRRQGPA